MKLISWFASVSGWDGFLPFVGVVSIVTIQFAFPKNDLAELSVVILVPMVVAIIRAAIAVNQIKSRCQGIAPLGRQLALAAAIVILFLFEVGSGLLTIADDEPIAAWLGPVLLYLLYLVCIFWALRPMPNSSPIKLS